MWGRSLAAIPVALLVLAGGGSAWAAGGASIVEEGTPLNGVASAGKAAYAADASTSFFNPAGMARLDRHQLMAGGQLLWTSNKFDIDEGATDIFRGGDDGGDAGGWIPALSSFYVHKLGERWRGGISLTAPAGGGYDYNNSWAGRYYNTEVMLLALNLNPAVS